MRWPDDELADASRLLDFPLIPGVELTTDVGHVLAFGPLRKPLWMGYSLAELVEECAQSDTALVLPHPLRRYAGERAVKGGRVPPSAEEIVALPQWEMVHAIEAASTQTTVLEHTLTAAALSVTPRPAVGASDAHGPGLAGTLRDRRRSDGAHRGRPRSRDPRRPRPPRAGRGLTLTVAATGEPDDRCRRAANPP